MEFWGPADFSFIVRGRPRPQGSMKFIRKGSRSVPVKNEKLEHWRSAVTWSASRMMEELNLGIFEAGVFVHMEFYFRRPKNQYRTGKYSHLLKDSAPAHMIKAPDLDKLVRAVLDSLTGIAFVDDSQVVGIRAMKEYGDEEKLICKVTTHVTRHELKGGNDAVRKGQEEKEEEGG